MKKEMKKADVRCLSLFIDYEKNKKGKKKERGVLSIDGKKKTTIGK